MTSFTAMLTLGALGAFTAHTGGVAASPVEGPHYLAKRVAAVSASTWRAEQEPHAFMTARNMRRQVTDGLESTSSQFTTPVVKLFLDVVQGAQKGAGIDDYPMNVDAINGDLLEVKDTADGVSDVGQGAAGSITPVGADGAALNSPGKTPTQSGSMSTVCRRFSVDAPTLASFENAGLSSDTNSAANSVNGLDVNKDVGTLCGPGEVCNFLKNSQ